jgi:hypothetical protein
MFKISIEPGSYIQNIYKLTGKNRSRIESVKNERG